MNQPPPPRGVEICPPSLAWLLANPLRLVLHNPQKMLAAYELEGKTCADIGCGPGYFTIPMARLAGESGKVIAVDLQPEMLEMVRKRASAAKMAERIQYHNCGEREIGLGAEAADFALAFWMVHETLDPAAFMRQVFALLRPGGRFLFVEPVMHVSAESFESSLRLAVGAGFKLKARPQVAISRAGLLFKPDKAG